MAKFDRSFSTSTLFGTPYELTRLACESCNVVLGMRKDEFSSFTNGTEKITLHAEHDPIIAQRLDAYQGHMKVFQQRSSSGA